MAGAAPDSHAWLFTLLPSPHRYLTVLPRASPILPVRNDCHEPVSRTSPLCSPQQLGEGRREPSDCETQWEWHRLNGDAVCSGTMLAMNAFAGPKRGEGTLSLTFPAAAAVSSSQVRWPKAVCTHHRELSCSSVELLLGCSPGRGAKWCLHNQDLAPLPRVDAAGLSMHRCWG